MVSDELALTIISVLVYTIATCTELLGHHNMREVLDYFWIYRARWKLIGIQLGIDTSTLDVIEKDNHDSEDRLVKLISRWLHGNKPKPTRNAMASAVQSQQVAGEVSSIPGE